MKSIAGLLLVTFAIGCGVKDRECLPNDYTFCKQDITYWMDTCGNQGDIAEECDCGCNQDYTGCEPCECEPQCTDRECGLDGCEGSCGECQAAELCNPAGQCVAADDCGNGVVENTEQCDGTDFGDQSCLTAAGHQSGELSCTASCYLDVSDCYTCGNYNVESAEDCDGQDLNSGSCEQLGYYPGDLACKSDCSYDLSGCIAAGRCGDGSRNGPEACDGSDLGTADCLSLGFDGGTLSCGADCEFVTSGCIGCEPDPCTGVDCSGHGVCQHTECVPRCECDDGYYAPQGELRCLPEGEPDPCEEQDCSGHGRCELDENNQPYCVCDEGYGPGPDNLTCTEECAWTFFSVESVPPNLLLVVDKSGSMSNPASEGGSRSKLQDAQDALSMMLDEGQGAIRFGWMEFPTDDTCAPGAVQVECSDLSIPDIRDKIQALVALGGTPTGPTLDAANNYQGLHDTARANFAVLLTDGMPTCPNGQGNEVNPEDAALALQAVQALHTGEIESFMIGLGEDLNSSDPDLLNQMALAGGRPRPSDTKYYMANNLEELQFAVTEIEQIAIKCNLTLDQAPGQLAHLWVLFDGNLVAMDPQRHEGWDYDQTRRQLLFYGSACQRLRSGEVNQVVVKEGCLPP